MATHLDGGCPCGAVRFRARGEPQDWVRCDCDFCVRLTRRRSRGDPVWPNAQVKFAGGAIGSTDHRSDEHPRPLTVHFCIACGTAVSLSFDGRRSLRCLLSENFDEPSRLRGVPAPRAGDGRSEAR